MRVGTQMTPTLTQTIAMATWVLLSVLNMDQVIRIRKHTVESVILE